MNIPYVIDNQTSRLALILKGLLDEHKGRSLDVATAYFTVGGFEQIKEGIFDLGNFRLLLGAEPTTGENLGLIPDVKVVKGLITHDLEDLPFDEKTLRTVEELVAYLRRDSVLVRLHDKGFLHAKCWLFYSDRPGQQLLFDRFRPIVAIVGSSNFTLPGLTSNRELNLAHKVLLDRNEIEDPDAAYAVSWLTDTKPSDNIKLENRQLLKSEVGARAIIDLEQWYNRQWQDSRDFKGELIELLDASKFGSKEYTPYEVYMKALYEYFKDDLDEEIFKETRSVVELAEFQENAVKKARKILARYDGVMVADSVGLGKTWIGKKLLEDFAYHLRQKAVVVCPASLRQMWEYELSEATISANILSQEELGREEFDPTPFVDADVILIDESHNFRNKASQRYGSLERIIAGNGGRGRDSLRKKLILLTATPINNDLMDLYNQISLITQGDRSYFSSCGIGDVYKYFLRARRASRKGKGVFELFNLLEEVVIRRTRPFIRKAYPEATIRGKTIRFPERKLKTVQYNLEATYAGIYDRIVSRIDKLKLAQYNLEAYKKAGVEVDDFEIGREKALVGIFKTRYLKRLESSIEAFRISIKRALAFLQTFESFILDGKVLRSADFHKAIRYLERESEEDDAIPQSVADEMEEQEDAKQILESMEEVDPAQYNLRSLHKALQHDIKILTDIFGWIKDLSYENDVKLSRLKELLSTDLKGKKVLVFSYYKDTARYLYKHIGHPDSPHAVEFCEQLGGIHVRRMDSGASPKERVRIVKHFAPKSNNQPEISGTEKEIDVLISTDVLSEGQNLQDCGYMINYDLHWNPTRMIQRAGRIDRIGTEFTQLMIYNTFPDEGLEKLLKLVERLNQKIAAIDRAGFLDASILGETVHPKNFNTLRRICEEDGSVIEEEEQFSELASNEFLIQSLKGFISSDGKESFDELPDGIHSGLVREHAKGIFFYFKAKGASSDVQHFWKYYDLKDKTIIDNRFLIANLIACDRDTPRVVEPSIFKSIFEIQEYVVDSILEAVGKQKALEVAPKTIDPIQQTLATVLQGYMNHPDFDRQICIDIIRFLNQPMMTFQIRACRQAYRKFQTSKDVKELMLSIDHIKSEYSTDRTSSEDNKSVKLEGIKREDLRLICFDIVTS